VQSFSSDKAIMSQKKINEKNIFSNFYQNLSQKEKYLNVT